MRKQYQLVLLITALGWLLHVNTVISAEISTTRSGLPVHNLTVGQTLSLRFGSIERVAIGNGEVLQVKVLDKLNEVLVIAKNPGITDLIIWGKSGEKNQYIIQIEGYVAGPTESELKKLLQGDESIMIKQIKNTYLLEGVAKTKQQYERLKLLADTYPNLFLLAFPPMFEHRPTVLLHAQFLEVKRSALDKIGIDWADVMNGPFFTFTGSRGSMDFSSSLTSVINLLTTNGDARLLAEPTLSSISGGSAKFLAGGELPIPVTGNDGQVSVIFKEFGIKLDIRPLVDDMDYIQTEVDVEVSSIDPAITVMNIPGLLTRKASTEMNVFNGETMIMAGLFSQEGSKNIDKVPGLSRIPIIGELFKSREFRNSESELVVLVTPKIIKPNDTSVTDNKKLFSRLLDESERDIKFSLMD